MPKVNLVPAEERQRELRRQFYIVPVAGALVLAGVMGGSYYYYNNQVSNSEKQLQDIKNSNASLQKQVDELKRYEEVKNKKQTQLNIVTGLYGQRVRWSRTLGDLAFVIPDDVWLTSIKAKVPGAVTAGNDSSSSSEGDVRDIEIEGYTRGMPSVAVFLVRLGLIPSLMDVTLLSAEKEELSSQIVTHFKIAATLKQTGETQGPSVAPVTGEDGPSSVTPTTGTSTTPTTGTSTTPTGTTPRTTGTTR